MTGLTVKEVKAGPRRPAGGYENSTKTIAGGVGELVGERVKAPALKSGPTPPQWDGRHVTRPPKRTGDPALDGKSRVITS